MLPKDKQTIIRLYASFYKKASKLRERVPISIPKLFSCFKRKKTFTISGLSIVFFYFNLGKIVTKKELVEFISSFGLLKFSQPNPRHFGMQYGFNFLVRDCWHPVLKTVLKPGEYCLVNLDQGHPTFKNHSCANRIRTRSTGCYKTNLGSADSANKAEISYDNIIDPQSVMLMLSHRSVTLTSPIFKALKAEYDDRCAVCGSLENSPHFKNKALITRLEQGHCDPDKPLTVDNCIPICTYCNQVYRNTFIFNKRGFLRVK